MSASDDRRAVADATESLAVLTGQAARLREQLAELRGQLAELRHAPDTPLAQQLREANEKLVLAVLRADGIAATAVDNLAQLTRAIQHDPLNGIANRMLMREHLDAAMAVAQREGAQLALLLLDLDQFHAVNDRFGRDEGDRILQRIARRLAAAVGRPDTVSRHGGNGFVVLLPQLSQTDEAERLAARLLEAVSTSMQVGQHTLHLTASIGIALYPRDGAGADVLIESACIAMHRSKRSGPGRVTVYADAAPDEPEASPKHAGRPCPARYGDRNDADDSAHRYDLRSANAQLLVAALRAQAAAADATGAHSQLIRFMAMVAHELRNPLTPIRLAASTLADPDRSGRRSAASLNMIIETQVAHMARLIDDLLDGSRISTGKLRLERSQVDLQDVLAIAVETCGPSIEAKQQQLSLWVPDGPVYLQGDPVRLAQIVSNLLDNASKYTGERGALTLALSAQDNTVTLSLSDNGVGIAPEVLPTIFDMFVQDARDSQLSHGGLGIGLAVVRDLVQAHGGTVTASSAGKNLGSRFVVTLPRTGARTTGAEPTSL
jgi:diguanylate cyclase (GGDEF)-like protein